MDDELGQGGVELLIRERQFLGGGASHRDRGMALLRCRDERLRGIDGAHGRRPRAADEFGRQGTRTAPDVHHPLSVATPAKFANSGASGTEYLPMNRS